MRLRKVEAIRYGAMRDVSLGPFGDGLNIVYGSNEAGKSTFASLIRNVVFEFPRKGGVERDYLPDGDENRAGRLVFEDEDGSNWTLTRSGAISKGTAELTGPHGNANATTFIDQLKSGIERDLYRHVFGFGLEELAEFDSLSTIQDHLHAGATGLQVNPREVLNTLDQRAGELFVAGGRKRRINEVERALKDVRSKQRELADAAGEFAGERRELARVETLLAERRDELEQMTKRSEHLAAMAAQATALHDRAEVLEHDIKDAAREEERITQELGTLKVDDALLEKTPVVETLAAGLESYEAQATERREADSMLSQRDQEVESALSVLGTSWTGEQAIAFRADPANESAAGEFATRVERLTMETDAASTKLERARAVLEEAETEVRAAASGAGLPSDVSDQEIAAAKAQTDLTLKTGGSTTHLPLAAIALALIGVVVGVWGALSSDWVTAILGGIAFLVAGVLLVVRLRSGSAGTGGDARAALDHRGALDVLAERQAEHRRLRKELAANEQEAQLLARRQEELDAEWAQWCGENGFGVDRGPRFARDIAASVSRLAQAAQRAGDARSVLGRIDEAMGRYEASARGVGIETQDAAPEAIAQAVRAVAASLMTSKETAERRKELDAELKRIKDAMAERAQDFEEVRGDLAAILEQAEVASSPEMEGAVAAAREVATQVREEVAKLSSEQGEFVGRLDVAGQEDEQAALSLQASELEQRLTDDLGRYAVLAVASKMLRGTLEQYERNRQPEVIQRAEESFSAITEGRYCKILNPLGEFDPIVCGADGAQKENEILSTGTAQQLYLALRLAYIETLGDRGPALPVLMDDILVNFDDDRRAETAQQLAAFATGRQVVLFTCHRATVETFSKLGPAPQIIEM